jgi:hypothetical protein
MTWKTHLCLIHIPLFLLLSLAPPCLPADETSAADGPRISIIIDDIGYRWIDDRKALALPGPLAYAIMPHSPHAELMARMAAADGKEVILHLPMEAIEQQKNRFLGPGALMLDMSRGQFMRTLYDDLRAFPNIIGVNNHMGSLLTQYPGQMKWLMESLRRRDMFYIDSVTIHDSVASSIARQNRVPYRSRDVFLDHRRDPEYIRSQFDKLLRLARARGFALAIGHPHPETITMLARRLPQLQREGVRLVRLSHAVRPAPAEQQPPLLLTRHP